MTETLRTSDLSSTILDSDLLLGLRDQWCALGTAGPSPATTPEWAAAWHEVYGGAYDVRAVEVRERDRLVALLPLVQSRNAVGRLELLSAAELREPCDVLGDDTGAIRHIAQTLGSLRAPLLLRRLPSDSPLVRGVSSLASAGFRTRVRPVAPSPYLPLDSTWTEPERHLSSRRRSDLRRAWRRAGELGTVRVDVRDPGADTAPALFDEFAEVEARSWKARHGTALRHAPAMLSFFRLYAREAAQRRRLRVSFLRIGDRPVAAQLATRWRNRLWLLKIGFDEEYSRCSPGQLLMVESLRAASEAGLASVEFLGRPEPWTDVWTKDKREYVELTGYPTTVRGGMAALVDAGRVTSGPARSRLRLAVRDRAKGTRRDGAEPAGRTGPRSPEDGRSPGPADPSRGRGRAVLRKPVRVLTRRAGRAYLVGPHREDALRAARQLERLGFTSHVSYWNSPEDSGPDVAAELLSLAGETGGPVDGALETAIKVPALRYDEQAVAQVVQALSASSGRVWFDSHAYDTVDRTLRLVHAQAGRGCDVGVAVPARWARSAADMREALGAGIAVRLVKGQLAAPVGGLRDLRRAFLDLVDECARLGSGPEGGPEAGPEGAPAGRVAVATHDVPLLAECLPRLRAAGISCEVQLLYGLPVEGPIRLARRHDVPVRFYLAYGSPSLVYSPRAAKENPRTVWWLVKDALRGSPRRRQAALAEGRLGR